MKNKVKTPTGYVITKRSMSSSIKKGSTSDAFKAGAGDAFKAGAGDLSRVRADLNIDRPTYKSTKNKGPQQGIGSR